MKKNNPLKKTKEGSPYDRLIKENLLGLLPVLFRLVLGDRNPRTENLPQVKIQRTAEREPDVLLLVFTEKYPDGAIFHAEFHLKDEDEMDYRMMEYGAMSVRRYRKPIIQVVVYLGDAPPTKMRGRIAFEKNNWEYLLLSASSLDHRHFLQSDQPEEVIFAILCDPKGVPIETIIKAIIGRILHLGEDTLAVQKFLRQLEILSGIRKLQKQTTNIIDDMNFFLDITEDVRYQQGESVGVEKGMEKGMAKKAIVGIVGMKHKGFPVEMMTELLKVTPEFAQDILAQLEKEAEITAALKAPGADLEAVSKKLGISPLLAEVLWEEMTSQK